MTPTAKQLAQEYAAQFRTQVSSEGLQNIATDYLAGRNELSESIKPVLAEAIEAIRGVIMKGCSHHETMDNLENVYEKLKSLEILNTIEK